MIKTILNALLLLALCGSVRAQESGSVVDLHSAHHGRDAVIGKTVDELRARFGHEKKSEPAWNGGTAYSFVTGDKGSKGGYYIYTTVGNDGKAEEVFYGANQWPFRKLSIREADQFYLDNEGDKVYDNFTYSANFNARHQHVKGYGMEKGFNHWVEYSWDGTTGLISNYGPLNKPESERFGYQIRTITKFNEDQKTIKAMLLKK